MDKAEELNKVRGVKPGDLWLVGNHRLVCGDSTKEEDVARVPGDARPVPMVTDPPYKGVRCGLAKQGHANKNDEGRWTDKDGRAKGKVLTTTEQIVCGVEVASGDVAYVWHAGNMAHIVAVLSVLRPANPRTNHLGKEPALHRAGRLSSTT